MIANKPAALALAFLLSGCSPAISDAEVFAQAVSQCRSIGQEPYVKLYYGRLIVRGCTLPCRALDIEVK